MTKKGRTLLVFLVLLGQKVTCQSTAIDSLISKVASLQQKDSEFYSDGLFPSQRIYLNEKNYCKEDNNIFFTALIAWTLRKYRDNLSDSNKKKCDSILVKAIRNFPRYRNRKGGVTFNFWPTNPSLHFPGDSYFSRKQKYALPDDADDTAILYLASGRHDSSAHIVHRLLQEHANGSNKVIRNTFSTLRNYQAYSTWFGKKMPIDFDLCVHANAMTFIAELNIDFHKADMETFKLIKKIVGLNYHLKYPHVIAPHYQNKAVILYHLARLLSNDNLPETFTLRHKIISDIYEQQKTVSGNMEKLLLQNALLMLGEKVVEEVYLQDGDLQCFYFFVANMTSTLPNPFKRWFSSFKRTNFYYRSEAYYYALLIENACLKL